MRIVFMGTPQFAVASLDILVKNKYDVVGVVTSPDKPAGRGQQLQQSAVKQYAVSHGLKTLQPINLKDENFIAELQALNADLQVVVAFRMLPEKVWNMPPLGTYNVHASLLPDYRGAAPINWAIINGEKETGVTTFKLKHEIDTGSILLQDRVTISPEMNAGDLHDVLMVRGAELLLRSVKMIAEGNVELKEQSSLLHGRESKHAPKIFKNDCKIDWSRSGESIHNLVRGLSPYPCAWTELKHDEKRTTFKIFSCKFHPVAHNNKPGIIKVDSKTLNIACKDGWIFIEEIQMEGKKRLRTEDLLRGYSFPEMSYFA